MGRKSPAQREKWAPLSRNFMGRKTPTMFRKSPVYFPLKSHFPQKSRKTSVKVPQRFPQRERWLFSGGVLRENDANHPTPAPFGSFLRADLQFSLVYSS